MVVPALLVAVLAAGVAVSLYFDAGRAAPGQWWPWAPFGWLFFIPALFVGFLALRWFWWGNWGGRGWCYQEEDAIQVLGVRFARGELTKEQFEQMKEDLRG